MVCDETVTVLLFKFDDLGIRCGQFLLLPDWHFDIADGDSYASLCRVGEAKAFDLVSQFSSFDAPILFEAIADYLSQVLFLHRVVLEAQALWQGLIENDTSNRCCDPLPIRGHSGLVGWRIVIDIDIAQAYLDRRL